MQKQYIAKVQKLSPYFSKPAPKLYMREEKKKKKASFKHFDLKIWGFCCVFKHEEQNCYVVHL